MAVKGDGPVGGQIPEKEPGVGSFLPPGGARPPFLLPLQGALETLEGQEEGGGTERQPCYQMLMATPPPVPPQAVFNLTQAPPPPRTWAS